ncbi:phosphate ABC transporter permease PstA [Corynebacterium guangdongense]|uniref:Phosphate transport system permease protein PstA n=1 Tax=Corynebacterium guangdongense TaxID=1783348 RepID=A0ABU1ZZ50_9CORY|nr:phosphate ABC transporter permease PstA [Corynebacterium guangdongense]MDR7330218.1 phosphate transport system permease protein [Corynebacterium guangdongense]WJZ18776.1 Phosphate transport system permease protein PstA [Corynebacterium guangdongense]
MSTTVSANTTATGGSVFTHISGSRKTTNTIMTGLVWFTMLLAMVPLVWVLWTVISQGIGILFTASWWTEDQGRTPTFMEGGGALHAIIGTVLQTVVAALISVPIGIFTAIYLVEYSYGNRLGRITTFMVDILSGVPSIVAALFVYALWITNFGFGRSGFAVTLSLILLMIPLVVRNTEEMLRVVPMDLREASYALGVPKWKTIQKIVLPTALSGIVTGVMLAIARVMGESAPVLILVGSTRTINWDIFEGPQSSLPLMMLDMYKSGTTEPTLDKLWGAALTLVLIIAILNIAARVISDKFSVKK